MKDISLTEFCREKSQYEAGQIMGCTQSAVSQMIRSGRNIYFFQNEAGAWEYKEIRKPGKKKAA